MALSSEGHFSESHWRMVRTHRRSLCSRSRTSVTDGVTFTVLLNATVGAEVRSDASKLVSDTVWTAGTLSAPSSSVTTRVSV